MITNEEKRPLKDMEPEEIKAILNCDDRQIYRADELQWFCCSGNTVVSINSIYREKPKNLSPNELYEAVKSLEVKIERPASIFSGSILGERLDVNLWEVLNLIKQLEGYHD